MIVLHALWSSSSKLLIWGEDSALSSKITNKPERISKSSQPKPHPFACDPDWLREATSQINGLLSTTYLKLALLLPTNKGLPQPSPHLFLPEIVQGGSPGLQPWTVSSIAYNSTDTIDLLLSLPEGTLPGVVIGESLRYFSEVVKLTLEFVSGGKVIPTLNKQGEDYFAHWRPIAESDEDNERLRLLARSMPAVCRSELVKGSIEGQAPGLILSSMIETIADTTVRQLLGDHSLLITRNGRGRKSLPGVKSWLAALTSESAKVTGDSAQLRKLQKSLNEWEQGALAAQGTFRTCFRLSPPDEQNGKQERANAKNQEKWRLEFLLQAADDKSLLIPADLVWKTKGDTLTFLKRRIENPQERLLEDLGKATRLYPGLEPALREATPVRMELDTRSAYSFLREAAPLLEQSGFGLLVPSWWKKPPVRLGVKLTASPKSDNDNVTMGLLGLENLCKFKWEIALGDELLTLDDLKRLASLKVPLVKMRGQWIELKKDEIDAALAFFQKRKVSGEMTVGEVLRSGLGLAPSQAGLPVVGVEARGWLGEFLKSNGEQKFKQLKTPKDFVGRLRPYQERGLSWLSFLGSLGLGACLADDMGLGKTIELLSLLVAERQNTGIKSKRKVEATLLICPMSVVGNWERETEKFAPMLKVHVHHGAGRRTKKSDFTRAVRGSDLVLTTYALAARDKNLLGGINWHRVVLDEAQNIKNSSTKQTQAIRSLKSSLRVAMTGTPVENRLSELWSIMEFLNPGLLGPIKDFKIHFSVPIERYRDEERAKLLKHLTGPFILRRLKTDKSIIRDLPDKFEMKSYCNLTKEQASLYQAVVDEMMEKVDKSEGIDRKGQVFSMLMKLKQVCNHPAHLLKDGSSLEGRSGKLAYLEEILEEILSVGEKALCFTQFFEMGEMLERYLQEKFGREVLFLHGGTSKKNRDKMVERFQQKIGPPIFLLSLKAGGTGLNLTEACHVIHFDRWWNPAVEDQATDRAFRIGQKKNVQVRKFICVGTLEERIDKMIEGKKELADRIVGTGEAWLSELSTDQIRELITLSADAVSED
jgi:SNF2 family DNA or RNA helicase